MAATINACLASADGSKPANQVKVAPAPAASLTHRPSPAARASQPRATISFDDASSAPDWMKEGNFASTLASALHSADAMRDGRLLPEEVVTVLQMPQLGLSAQQQDYLQKLFFPDSRDGYCDYRTALLRSVPFFT